MIADELCAVAVHNHIVTGTEYPFTLVSNLELEGPVRERLGLNIDPDLADRIGSDVLEPVRHDFGSVEVDGASASQSHFLETV